MKSISASAWPHAALVLAALVLAVFQLTAIARNNLYSLPPKPLGDGPEYENLAYHVWQGKGFRVNNQDPGWRTVYEASADEYSLQLNADPRDMLSTGRPPLLPAMIAGCYSIFGRGPLGFAAVRTVSALLLAVGGAMAVGLTAIYLAGLRTAQGKPAMSKTAIAAGALTTLLLMASNRTLREYATDFLTEPVAFFLMQWWILLAAALAYKASQRSTFTTAIGLGGVLGLMVMARSIFVVWLPGLWLLLLLGLPGSLRKRTQVASLTLLMALTVCLPWWARNIIVLEQWMPLGTQGPITLLGGYSDEALAAAGEWQFAPEMQLREELKQDPQWLAAENDIQREIIVSQTARRRLRDWIQTHWQDLGAMFWGRLLTHWNPYSGRSLIWKLLALAGVVGVLSRVRPGIPSSGGDDPRFENMLWMISVLLIGLPILSSLVAMGLYTTGGRFLVPLYGVISTLSGIGAGCGIQAGWQWIQRPRA